jgi:hypothetical protein
LPINDIITRIRQRIITIADAEGEQARLSPLFRQTILADRPRLFKAPVICPQR